jgi:hypothetical protein
MADETVDVRAWTAQSLEKIFTKHGIQYNSALDYKAVSFNRVTGQVLLNWNEIEVMGFLDAVCEQDNRGIPYIQACMNIIMQINLARQSLLSHVQDSKASLDARDPYALDLARRFITPYLGGSGVRIFQIYLSAC